MAAASESAVWREYNVDLFIHHICVDIFKDTPCWLKGEVCVFSFFFLTYFCFSMLKSGKFEKCESAHKNGVNIYFMNWIESLTDWTG